MKQIIRGTKGMRHTPGPDEERFGPMGAGMTSARREVVFPFTEIGYRWPDLGKSSFVLSKMASTLSMVDSSLALLPCPT